MLEKSSFKKSLETHFSRSKMFPIFTMHMMSIRDKKKLTNDFIEFHQFRKKGIDTAEDFGIDRSSRS